MAAALLFQPRIVGTMVLLGVLLQSAVLFLVLGTVLWWSALLPRWNPFDALFNAHKAPRPGAVRLSAAPAPRRFSQGMAGTFRPRRRRGIAAAEAGSGYVLQGFFLAAAAAIGLGKFCLGSFLFHLLRGRAGFAMRTLPWARS